MEYNNLLYDDNSKNKWNNHVDLSLWADIMIIAPLTAKTITSHNPRENIPSNR